MSSETGQVQHEGQVLVPWPGLGHPDGHPCGICGEASHYLCTGTLRSTELDDF